MHIFDDAKITKATLDRNFNRTKLMKRFKEVKSGIAFDELEVNLASQQVASVSYPASFVKSRAARVLLAGAGFLADAYDLFVINLVLRLLRDEYPEYKTSGKLSELEGAVASAALFGSVLGQLVAGSLADIIGRKKIFIFTAILITVGCFGSACSLDTPTLTVYGQIACWRFFLGAGVGGEYPLAATVTSESSSASRRGALMAAVFAMQGVGALLSVLVVIICLSLDLSSAFTWRFSLAFGAMPVLIAFPWRLRMHETETFERVQQSRRDMNDYNSSSSSSYGSMSNPNLSSNNNISSSGNAHLGGGGITGAALHTTPSMAMSNNMIFNHKPSVVGMGSSTGGGSMNPNDHVVFSSPSRTPNKDVIHKITTPYSNNATNVSSVIATTPLESSVLHEATRPRDYSDSYDVGEGKYLSMNGSVVSSGVAGGSGTGMASPGTAGAYESLKRMFGFKTVSNQTIEENSSLLHNNISSSMSAAPGIQLQPSKPNNNNNNNNITRSIDISSSSNNAGIDTSTTPISFSRYAEVYRAWMFYKWHIFGTAMSWFLLDVVFYANGLFNHDVTKIILSAGKPTTALQDAHNSMLLCLMGIPGYWLSVFYMDRVGRKSIQINGFLIMAFLFTVCAVFHDWFLEEGVPPYRKWFFLLLYSLTFLFSNFGPNTTTFVIPGEIYPPEVKATCHGFSAASGKLGAAAGAYLFPLILNGVGNADSRAQSLGLRLCFFTCAVVAVLGSIVTHYFIPTYNARDLEDPDAYLSLDHECIQPNEETFAHMQQTMQAKKAPYTMIEIIDSADNYGLQARESNKEVEEGFAEINNEKYLND